MLVKSSVEILTDKVNLIARAQEIILEKIESVIEAKGICTVALSGGSTPKPLYESLATCDLPWEKIHIFWGDERYVPADHVDSNQFMTRQAWLSRISIPDANIHPMPTSGMSPEQDALTHEDELRSFFKLPPTEFPAFDIVILGMGDDGHTASLFPNTKVLKETKKLVAVGNKSGESRLTFTVPLLNKAKCVLFLVSGANKKEVLNKVFASDEDSYLYPARLIQPEGELRWLIDKAAGELLK